MREAVTWWLRASDSVARRITPAGILIGRSPRCDLVVPSDRVSRRQALVYLSDRGPSLEVLGRAKTTVGGEDVARARALEPGDRITIADLQLEVECERHASAGIAAGTPVWVLEGPSGTLFGVVRSPYLVGGGHEDDLRVEGWPPCALCFVMSPDGKLAVVPEVEVFADGEPLEPGQQTAVRGGATLELAGQRVRVVTGGQFASGSTGVELPVSSAITSARLEFLPRGGRLQVELATGDVHAVYLPDRRCDLIAILLQPPEPYAAGDFVDDEVVLGRVWSRAAAAGRTNLNVLLHRVRRDLDRAGLDGARLIERSAGGGATRFAIPAGARTELA